MELGKDAAGGRACHCYVIATISKPDTTSWNRGCPAILPNTLRNTCIALEERARGQTMAPGGTDVSL